MLYFFLVKKINESINYKLDGEYIQKAIENIPVDGKKWEWLISKNPIKN